VQTAGPGRPVLDHVGRPSVNFGGVVRGIDQVSQSAAGLARAVAPVLMDPRLFDGENRGLQALANGVADVGAPFLKYAERAAQAKNYADMADAEHAMNRERADFETWKQANLARPESWRQEWQRRLADLGKRFDKNETWSPLVKQKLRVEFGRFAGQSVIRVFTDATKATFARASEAVGAKFEMSVLNKDFEGAKAAKVDSVAMGLETPEQAAVDLLKASRGIARLELQEAIKTMPSVVLSFLRTKGDAETRRPGDTETNAAAGAAAGGATDEGGGGGGRGGEGAGVPSVGAEAAGAAAGGGGRGRAGAGKKILEVPDYIQELTDAEKVEARDLATASIFDQKRNLLNLGTQEIKAGHIKNGRDLQDWIETNDSTVVLDETDFSHLESVIAGARPLNQDADWNEAVAAITHFPVNAPEAEVRKREAYMKMEFDKRFSGPVRTELYQMLNERLLEFDDAKTVVFRDIIALSETMLREGKFGPVSPLPQSTNGQAPKDNIFGTAAPAGPEARRRAALKELHDWIHAQPVRPTRAEVFKRWQEITGLAPGTGAEGQGGAAGGAASGPKDAAPSAVPPASPSPLDMRCLGFRREGDSRKRSRC
jgi:hypothetical protein